VTAIPPGCFQRLKVRMSNRIMVMPIIPVPPCSITPTVWKPFPYANGKGRGPPPSIAQGLESANLRLASVAKPEPIILICSEIAPRARPGRKSNSQRRPPENAVKSAANQPPTRLRVSRLPRKNTYTMLNPKKNARVRSSAVQGKRPPKRIN